MRILSDQGLRNALDESEVDPMVLVERAGYAVTQFCASRFKFRSVCVVCGTGYKGGVGLIAAQVLARVAETVWVLVLARQADELRPHIAACVDPSLQPIWISGVADLESVAVAEALNADLVIDAIIGTGFRPPLRDLAAGAIAAINEASGIVVSVDVPSGVDAESVTPVQASGGNMVFAHGIIALFAPKSAHVFGTLTSGPIAISEIGAQPMLVATGPCVSVSTGQEVAIAFPRRQNYPQDGQFDHVLVVAGSRGKAGAAALAGLAALSAGAGRVTIACPKSIEPTIAGFGAALMTCGLPETDAGSIAATASGQIGSLLDGKAAVVIGPGLSANPETAVFIRRLAAECRLPVILEGDAVAAFAGHCDELRGRKDAGSCRVLLADPAEASRLLGTQLDADRPEAARLIAREIGACVVLKGTQTVVAGVSGEAWITMTGRLALTKAGSADVLAGMIGAALARNAQRPTEQAAVEHQQLGGRFFQDISVAAAVYVHGLAADIACDALHENTVLATDLIEALAAAFRECDRQIERGLFSFQS